MRTGYVSTMSLYNAPRSATTRMQSDLVDLNKEISTGRLSDVGLTLGAEAGQGTTLHIDIASFASIIDSNATASARLDQTQAALGNLATGAGDFMKLLIAARDTNVSPASLQAQGEAALSDFRDAANASDGHNYLFAGVNTDQPPLADYASGPEAALDAAFQAKFGMAPTDPAVSTIAPAAMSDFLDNEFAGLFADPAWGGDWSSASSQALKSHITQTESLDTSVSANQPAFRKLAMVYTMVAKLGTANLSADSRKVLIDKAIGVLGDATAGVTDLQAGVGIAQNRVTAATDRVTLQQTILETRVSKLEGVDPAEAKVKIDTLTNEIEMSYSMTSQFLKMSILNYL